MNKSKMNKSKIIAHFGEAFFDKVVACLDRYGKAWGLSHFEQVDYYSVNCLFTCISAVHGLCVLKINPDAGARENMTEYNMLKEFNGNGLCKVYEADTAHGVLLIERIVSGVPLRNEPDLDTRLNVFCQLFEGLHRPPSQKGMYPTYMSWVSRIAAYMRTREDYRDLCEKMTRAETICRQLWGKYSGEMLLHGDLHHDNILQGAQGYRIIDPKGVVGDRVFDIPRFMLNEEDLDKGGKFEYIVCKFAEKLGVPEGDIRRLFYVEMCMGNCWCVESGDDVDWEDVLFAERMLQVQNLKGGFLNEPGEKI